MLRSFGSKLAALWGSGNVGKAIIVFGFVLVCGALSAPFQPRRSAGPVTPTSAPAAAAVAVPTSAPAEPTTVPTEAPTNTPEPTAVPTNTPEPTPVPEPIALKGSGQNVTDKFTLPSPVSKLVITHKGRRNFIVTLYSGDGKQDLLVNTVGNYSGTRLAATTEQIYLEVQADGNWTIDVVPIGTTDAHATAFEGSGDAVSDLFTPASIGPVPYEFTHDGKRNFIVQLHCAGGSDLVQNSVGAASGAAVVRLSRGPCAWEVQADGAWSIRAR